MTTRLLKKIKMDMSLIKVMWKSSTLSCKKIMGNAIEFLMMLRVKYCFTQNIICTALKKNVMLFYSPAPNKRGMLFYPCVYVYS